MGEFHDWLIDMGLNGLDSSGRDKFDLWLTNSAKEDERMAKRLDKAKLKGHDYDPDKPFAECHFNEGILCCSKCRMTDLVAMTKRKCKAPK